MKRIRSLFRGILPSLALASLGLAGCTSMMVHFGGGVSKELQQNGVVARAQIQEVWDTGWTINDNPVIGMKVRVQPSDRPAFEATIEKTTVSRIATWQFQPGNTVPVRFDPANPAIVAVDYGAELSAAAASRGENRPAILGIVARPLAADERADLQREQASWSRVCSATRPPPSPASRSATFWSRSTGSRSTMSPLCRTS
jgi:hypothetical protein